MRIGVVACGYADGYPRVAPTGTPMLVDGVRTATRALRLSHREMVSGAGHDAIYIARVAPTSMIFVPCKDGISHSEIEDARPEHLEAGANVLLHAMLARAGASRA